MTTVAIVGAGNRGRRYASFADQYPDSMKVVAVAEPRDYYRNYIQNRHSVPDQNTFNDWTELASKPKLADAVIVATQDAMHEKPAVAFAKTGYHVLLEKPLAPTQEECARIIEAMIESDIIFAVGHVMRYTVYTDAVKKLVESGKLGHIVSIEHLEPVGYWHIAHSFVRGNWRNESTSSPMLLAKSCHDIDWLSYIVDSRCVSVSSYGSLLHFQRSHKPSEAGDALRCTDCSFEHSCPYSAKKLYLGMLRKGHTGWPVDVLTPEVNEQSILERLENGPYGRCVYECDNDVVDHQIVALNYENGVTANFTMTGFTDVAARRTRIFGSKGMIEGDGRHIRRYDFLTDSWTEIDTFDGDTSKQGAHGGGDFGLMKAFISAVAANDPSLIKSGPQESLDSHRVVFAAERSRLNKEMVTLD